MKVCHLCLNGPYNEGWNYQENIMPKYHVKQGHEVYQVVTRYMWQGNEQVLSNDTRYISENSVNVIRLKEKQSIFGKRFNKYPQLMDVLDEISPDILFIHDVQFMDIPKVVKYLKHHPNCIAYADSHTDFSNSATTWVSKHILHGIIWKHMSRKLIPVVKVFYGVLPARVDFLVDVYGFPKSKCELLVMGADDELVDKYSNEKSIEAFRNKYNISKEDFLIMTGGKIDLAKKQTLLLMDAVSRIQNKHVKLIIFGSVAKELQESVDKLLDGNKIQNIGWLSSEQSYEAFAAADLVVFPGRHSVFWEQVAGQGIPLVVKYWDGTTHVDLGGNTMFLYKDSSDEILDTVNRISSNEDGIYDNMKKVALKEGKKTFSYNDIAMRAISR